MILFRTALPKNRPVFGLGSSRRATGKDYLGRGSRCVHGIRQAREVNAWCLKVLGGSRHIRSSQI